MKAHLVIGLGLVGIGILIAVQTGCHRESGSDSKSNILAGNPHRVVTISSASPGSSNPCEVDFPVTQLTKRKNHTIAWAAADHDYWIRFEPSPGPIGSDKIKVANGTQTGRFTITISPSSPQYFTYAIYDFDPDTNSQGPPCKKATDDHDTGLNVKP
jgi:hypothetical protein